MGKRKSLFSQIARLWVKVCVASLDFAENAAL